jgi:cytochrome bd-type quinol oxidase subunit 2
MSAIEPSSLALFWAGVIVVAILMYVVLDGFDLGVGILFGTTGEASLRDEMMAAISPFSRCRRERAVGRGFLSRIGCGCLRPGGGSRGDDPRHPGGRQQYAGGAFEWLRPLPVLTGIGLVLGYALLGAGWLTLKSEGALRDWAWRRIPWLAGAVLVVLGVAVVAAFGERARVTRSLYLGRPWGLVFPVIGLLAMYGIFVAVRRRRDAWPFVLTAVFFVAALLSLAVMFWPYMIPYTITVGNAAAPDKSLSFLFWGAGVFVLPVILIYTAIVYWLFRGKLRKGYG